MRAYTRHIIPFILILALSISCLPALYAQGAASSVDYSNVSLNIALPAGQPSTYATAVDLGLTSNGRKLFWADRNIGAANINENGIFYAWGETRTNTVFTVAENYGNRIYIFKSRHSAHLGITAGTYFLTKYWNNPSIPADRWGFPNHANDGLHVLQPEDDAAHVIWGGDWRMPTKTEIDDLLTCNHSNFTNNSGVFISGRGGYSGNQIKVPAAGHMNESNHREDGAESNFWSSTLYEEGGRDVNSYNAYAYRCRKTGLIIQRTESDQTYEMRYDGFPVRPVIEARKLKINYTEDGNPCSSSEEKNIEYPKGASITLSATPATCKQFVRWDKIVNGYVVETYSSINPTITISDDATYTAVFETIKYRITTSVVEREIDAANVVSFTENPECGTVTETANYDCGSTITLIATAKDCYTFVGWQKKNASGNWEDVDGATEATLNVTVEANAEYRAVFSLKNISVEVIPNNATYGSVIFSGGLAYHCGDEISMTATPNRMPSDCYEFVKWVDSFGNEYPGTGNGSGVNMLTTTISQYDSKITYTAVFAEKTSHVEVINGTISVDDVDSPNPGDYPHCQRLVITAEDPEDDCKEFDYWEKRTSEGTTKFYDTPQLINVYATQDVTYEAFYKRKTVNITVATEGDPPRGEVSIALQDDNN